MTKVIFLHHDLIDLELGDFSSDEFGEFLSSVKLVVFQNGYYMNFGICHEKMNGASGSTRLIS